jgi:hypothetical protein
LSPQWYHRVVQRSPMYFATSFNRKVGFTSHHVLSRLCSRNDDNAGAEVLLREVGCLMYF